MANKLKNGSNCAACVRYPETDSDCWILTKVDKKLPGNKYLVRDEFADDPKYETYTVDSSHITPFPSTLNEEYKVGDTVLALWRDEDTNEWSTMFYNAEVAENNGSDPKTVQLLYSGTDFVVDVEKDKIARLPANFTFVEASEDKEDRTSTTATEEPSEDNSTKNTVKKGRSKEELNTTDSSIPSQAANADEGATNTEDVSESTTDEKATISGKDKGETTSNATPENSLAQVKSENPPSAAISGNSAASGETETDSQESKANGSTSTDQEMTTTNNLNTTAENTAQSQNEIQVQPTENEEKLDEQASDKNKRSKSSKDNTTGTSATSSSAASAASSSRLQTPEDRRIKFMFHRPEVAERPKVDYLTNEDFTRLAGPKQELERMHTIEGTPLLDYLEDPELFNQENLLHVTGSGVISVANVEKGDEKSGLIEGRIPCGRLKRIFNEWIKNPMDSI